MRRLLVAAAVVCLLHVEIAQAAGVSLVYQVEAAEKSSSSSPAVADIAKAVQRRVDALKVGDAKASVQGKDRIAIEFASDDAKEMSRVKESLAHPGHIEFRILADTRDESQADEIKLAGEPANKGHDVIHNADGLAVAEWVRQPASKHNVVGSKAVHRDTDGKHEVLALFDEWNITGRYITKFDKSQGVRGPQIEFELDVAGAKLMSKLTGENQPRVTGLTSSLGIIVDGQLITAATIQSQISNKGEITGTFSDAEVDELVARIGSGEIPAKLKLQSAADSSNSK